LRAILADTGPLYAAFDRSDQYYAQSRTQLQRLDEENIVVVISYHILLEAYGLVLKRLGTAQALIFLQNLIEGAELIDPTINDYQAAMQKVIRYPDQQISLFDALTAVISERLNIPVWTYDYHFDIMRVQVWR
jgi:predicted nucleic acid-binding protein